MAKKVFLTEEEQKEVQEVIQNTQSLKQIKEQIGDHETSLFILKPESARLQVMVNQQQTDLDKRLKRIYGDDYLIGENFEITKKQL